jgi:hypothetical protein
MMHYKSRLRMSLVLLIIVLLVLSCSTPLPTVISTSLPNHTQEVIYTYRNAYRYGDPSSASVCEGCIRWFHADLCCNTL